MELTTLDLSTVRLSSVFPHLNRTEHLYKNVDFKAVRIEPYYRMSVLSGLFTVRVAANLFGLDPYVCVWGPVDDRTSTTFLLLQRLAKIVDEDGLQCIRVKLQHATLPGRSDFYIVTEDIREHFAGNGTNPGPHLKFVGRPLCHMDVVSVFFRYVFSPYEWSHKKQPLTIRTTSSAPSPATLFYIGGLKVGRGHHADFQNYVPKKWLGCFVKLIVTDRDYYLDILRWWRAKVNKIDDESGGRQSLVSRILSSSTVSCLWASDIEAESDQFHKWHQYQAQIFRRLDELCTYVRAFGAREQSASSSVATPLNATIDK